MAKLLKLHTTAAVKASGVFFEIIDKKWERGAFKHSL